MKLSEEQFFHAMAALGCGEAQSPESRGRVLVPAGKKATIIPCNDASRGELTTIVVLNLSDTGIAVLNAAPMRTGDHFILRLTSTPVSRPLALLCSVIYSQAVSNGMFAIGAQFGRVLSIPSYPACEQFSAPGSIELKPNEMAQVREVEDRLSRLSL